VSVSLRLVPPPVRLIDAPEPNWAHIARLSDDTGLLEHARNAIVRREHGYCVDDVARGLLVASREPRPSAQVIGLAERYLAFLTHAQGADGAFRNRLAHDRLRPLNLVISNVPGSRVPLYLAGARMEAHFPVSVITDGVGLNITCMSYRDGVDVGIVADAEQLDDAWPLMDGLERALDELHDAVADLDPGRRSIQG